MSNPGRNLGHFLHPKGAKSKAQDRAIFAKAAKPSGAVLATPAANPAIAQPASPKPKKALPLQGM